MAGKSGSAVTLTGAQAAGSEVDKRQGGLAWGKDGTGARRCQCLARQSGGGACACYSRGGSLRLTRRCVACPDAFVRAGGGR
jgi:hypothetical protein